MGESEKSSATIHDMPATYSPNILFCSLKDSQQYLKKIQIKIIRIFFSWQQCLAFTAFQVTIFSVGRILQCNWIWTSFTFTTTNTREQSPWDANNHLASQEIPHILYNIKVHYMFARTGHWSIVLRPVSSIHTLVPFSSRSTSIFSANLCLGFPNDIFSSGFLTKCIDKMCQCSDTAH